MTSGGIRAVARVAAQPDTAVSGLFNTAAAE
jgi:hypothetical protein